MLRRSVLSLTSGQAPVTRAQRLSLGNIKTDYGNVQSAAGNHEKWGYMFRGWKYPLTAYSAMAGCLWCIYFLTGTWSQYKDMIIMSEHISYEDVEDRCLTPMPGWSRVKTFQIMKPWQAMTYRDPTPLEWLPFDLKLGMMKASSY